MPANLTPPKSQPDKFRDLARDHQANEDEKAFEEKVRVVVRAPRPPKPDES